MKKLINMICYVLFFAGLYLSMFSCKKDKSTSFVDDFIPTLTETAGILHNEDYYPFKAGYQWNWSGDYTATGSIVTSYNGQNSTDPVDENSSTYGYMDVLNVSTISLRSGTYQVYPTSETNGLSRYFQVSDSAVLLRAVRNSDSQNIVEVNNPVYIRKPLKTGDKWSSEPTVNFNDLAGEAGYDPNDFTLKTKCVIFVLGPETITRYGKSVSTIKLEDRIELTGSMNVNESGTTGTLNISMTMDVKLNLLKDTGIVSQVLDGVVKVTGSMTNGSDKLTINMNENLSETATLEDAFLFETTTKSGVLKSDFANISKPKTYSNHPVAQRQVEKIIDLLGKLKKIYQL